MSNVAHLVAGKMHTLDENIEEAKQEVAAE